MSSSNQNSPVLAHDDDAQETQEWLEALAAVLDREGPQRAHFLLERLVGPEEAAEALAYVLPVAEANMMRDWAMGR